MTFPLCDVSPSMAVEAAKILLAIMATIEIVRDDGRMLTFEFRGGERLLERLSEFGAVEECDESDGIEAEDCGRSYPVLRTEGEALRALALFDGLVAPFPAHANRGEMQPLSVAA